MARVEGKFLRGLVGNLVSREYRGKQIIQSKPHTLPSHRTVGTKQAANTFGQSSKLASGIRWGLTAICGKFYDGTMSYRLNTEMLYCLHKAKDKETQRFNFQPDTFQSLAGFEFNTNSMVKKYLLARPLITIEGNRLKVSIPEMKVPVELKFPIDRPKCCKLIIAVAQIDLSEGKIKFGKPQLLEIPYSYKPLLVPGQTVEFEVEAGCLCVTAISLEIVEETFAGDSIINNKAFHPAAIIAATLLEGNVDPATTKGWQPFDFKMEA